jgi:hypothetical protein
VAKAGVFPASPDSERDCRKMPEDPTPDEKNFIFRARTVAVWRAMEI